MVIGRSLSRPPHGSPSGFPTSSGSLGTPFSSLAPSASFIFITFPTAPPRLTDLEVVDTVTEYTSAYRLLQPPALTNPYAAVPSLHFGWNLLIGIAYIKQGPNLGVKAIGVMLPIAMFFAIVLTANHWILDAVAGAIVALAGLAIAYRITKPGDPNEPTPAQRIARAWAQR
jgi:membrane-associated phospholipid phosphatase